MFVIKKGYVCNPFLLGASQNCPECSKSPFSKGLLRIGKRDTRLLSKSDKSKNQLLLMMRASHPKSV